MQIEFGGHSTIIDHHMQEPLEFGIIVRNTEVLMSLCREVLKEIENLDINLLIIPDRAQDVIAGHAGGRRQTLRRQEIIDASAIGGDDLDITVLGQFFDDGVDEADGIAGALGEFALGPLNWVGGQSLEDSRLTE